MNNEEYIEEALMVFLFTHLKYNREEMRRAVIKSDAINYGDLEALLDTIEKTLGVGEATVCNECGCKPHTGFCDNSIPCRDATHQMKECMCYGTGVAGSHFADCPLYVEHPCCPVKKEEVPLTERVEALEKWRDAVRDQLL